MSEACWSRENGAQPPPRKKPRRNLGPSKPRASKVKPPAVEKPPQAAVFLLPAIVNGVNGQPLHTTGGLAAEIKEEENTGSEERVHVACFLPQAEHTELIASRTSSPAPATADPAAAPAAAQQGGKQATPPSEPPRPKDVAVAAAMAAAGKCQKPRAKASSLPPEPKKGHAMKGAAELHAGKEASSQQEQASPAVVAAAAAAKAKLKKAGEKAGGGKKKPDGGEKVAGGKARKKTPPLQPTAGAAEGQKAKETKKKQQPQLQQGKKRKESPPKISIVPAKATKTNRALQPGLVSFQFFNLPEMSRSPEEM